MTLTKENRSTAGGKIYRGADKSLARPGRKQARKHVRDARDFNNIEKRAIIKFFLPEGKAPKEIYAILTETLAFFLPDRVTDLSAPLYVSIRSSNRNTAWSGVGLNPAPCAYRTVANRLTIVKNTKTKTVSKRSSFPPAENHWPVGQPALGYSPPNATTCSYELLWFPSWLCR